MTAVGLAALLGIAGLSCTSSGPGATAVFGEVKQVTLSISGMTCASCTVAVKTALRQIEGVAGVEVAYEQKQASVSYDPARVAPEELVEALNQLGYQASLPKQGS